MFDAHAFIDRLGVIGARQAAASPMERACIDAAAALRDARSAPHETRLAHIAMTCLPHRAIPIGATWRRRLGDAHYLVEGGEGPVGSGVPYGAKARIILLHLIDGALRAASPAVEVQASMGAWMREMDIAPGGMSYRHIAAQAQRIARCRMQIAHAGEADRAATPIIAGLDYDGDTAGAFPSRVILSDAFYQHVQTRPVTLHGVGVRSLRDNSWALDLYVWLATVLPALEAPASLAWEDFLTRIDFGHAAPRKTRAKLIDTLSLVKAVYPGADVTTDKARITFRPSSPPIGRA